MSRTLCNVIFIIPLCFHACVIYFITYLHGCRSIFPGRTAVNFTNIFLKGKVVKFGFCQLKPRKKMFDKIIKMQEAEAPFSHQSLRAMFQTYHNLLFHLKLVCLFYLFMWPTSWKKMCPVNSGFRNTKISASVIGNDKWKTSASVQKCHRSSSTSATLNALGH